MKSLKKNLKHYIYQRGRVTIGELENLIRQEGYKISNGERRLREIVNEGKIEPIRNKKGVVVGYVLKRLKTPERANFEPNKPINLKEVELERRRIEEMNKMTYQDGKLVVKF